MSFLRSCRPTLSHEAAKPCAAEFCHWLSFGCLAVFLETSNSLQHSSNGANFSASVTVPEQPWQTAVVLYMLRHGGPACRKTHTFLASAELKSVGAMQTHATCSDPSRCSIEGITTFFSCTQAGRTTSQGRRAIAIAAGREATNRCNSEQKSSAQPCPAQASHDG